ncbi:MAG TPA: ATP-binding protein [Desulfosarcina sp.]|nr:ATP-binding protein [Desulfosarcina sp.]
MTPLADKELDDLMCDLESDRVERKSSAADRSRIRRTICAFANDLPGHRRPGVVFVGARDDGTCAGLEVTDELLRLLSDMRSSGDILPPPTMTVQKRTVNGCRLAVITVWPSMSPPVRYQGRVWVRVGPTLDLATPEDERRLAEKRRSADLPFDHHPAAGAALSDLDLNFFQNNYLPAAIAPDTMEQNRRPIEQQLMSLRFLSQMKTPTYGSILMFGRDPLAWVPGAYVQFLRIDGTGLTDPIINQKGPELSGPLFEALPRLDELIDINVSSASDMVSGPLEIRHPDYPTQALRQLVRNAVMHRAFENTHAPVRFYWFVDRIEISNPGGLFGQVNKENFGQGVTDYRNPLVAEGMRVLGYVQRFGMGIPIAKSELEKNGNPPLEFRFEPGHFSVTIRRRL